MATSGTFKTKSEAKPDNVTLQIHETNVESSTDGPVAFTSGSGEPPAPPLTGYSEVPWSSSTNQPQAPPPTYDSLFGRVKALKEESSGTLDFVKKVFVHILGTVAVLILLGILLALPVSMLYMGGYYFHDCQISYKVPAFLLVGGICGVIRILISVGCMVLHCVKKEDENEDDEATCCYPKLDVLFIVYAITASVFVYMNNDFTTLDPEAWDYCNPTLYYYAFWLYTSFYILFGIFICCGCACMVYVMVTDDEDDSTPTSQ